MRAVVLTAGRPAGPAGWERCGDPMLWLADRPFAQHVAEALVRAGVRAVEWVLPTDAEVLGRFLGNGERWGLSLTRHPVPDRAAGYRRVRELAAGRPAGELVLVGHGDRLARLATVVAPPGLPPVGPTAVGPRVWSGWALAAWGALQDLPAGLAAEPELAGWLAGHGPATDGPPALDVLSPVTYLLSNRQALLAPEGQPELAGGPPAVRVSRRARVHPTARLIPPVAVAAGAEIAAHASVGPFVAVAADCVVDRHAALADVVLQPATYVGERVRLTRAVADGGTVVHVGPTGVARADTGLPVASLAPRARLRIPPVVGWAARAVRATARLGRAAEAEPA